MVGFIPATALIQPLRNLTHAGAYIAKRLSKKSWVTSAASASTMVKTMTLTRAPSALPSAATASTHTDFIKARLPNWATTANASVLTALRSSLINSNQSRHALKDLLAQVQNPLTFVQPLFREAVRRKFVGLVNADKSLFVREWSKPHLLGLFSTHAKTTEQSLLEAALQNFEPSEAEDGGIDTGSGLFTSTDSGRVPLHFTPIFFAEFCRSLDLGRRYQQHLNEILDPAVMANAALPSTHPRQVLRSYEQHSFESALHFAHLQGELGTDLYQQLLSLQKMGQHPDLLCNHLTIDGIRLPGVMVIRDRLIDQKNILYTPDDPLLTFRRHDSMDALKNELTQRLLSPRYLEFFNRFVPQRYRGRLITITQARPDTLPGGRPTTTLPAKVNEPITRTPITGDIFQAITAQRIEHIKQDARTLVVPTADADLKARQARLQRYKELEQSLLVFAASFVPVVGEVLLTVTGAQLINSVYNGFAAWSRGDSNQALNDLMDVVDTVATGLVTAGAIKTGSFTADLVKVKLSNQTWRLWNPDLTPYRSLNELPDGLPANTQGVYEHNQQYYLKLDDGAPHEVKQDPHTQQWLLQHPHDSAAFTPAMLTNGVGAWRHAYEKVNTWSDLKLITRLGPDALHLQQSEIEPILQISEVDSQLLRHIHQDLVRPPTRLRDTLKHFNLEQDIHDFTLNRAEGTTVSVYSPLIQFHLLSSLPEWPLNTVLNIVDDQQNTLLSFGTPDTHIKTTHINITDTQWRKGELLSALEKQLPASSFEALAQPTSIPQHAFPYFTPVTRLATRLSEEAVEHKQRLFTWLCEHTEKPVTAIEKHLSELNPKLTKSQLDELSAVLGEQDKSRLLKDKRLTAVGRWEADQYVQQSKSLSNREGIYLDSVHTPQSLVMTLFTLEQLPGWPAAHRIEIHDQTLGGTVIGSAGAKHADTLYILIREGEQYGLYTSAGVQLQEPADLFTALEDTLSDTQLQAILSQNGTRSLKQAVCKLGLPMLGNPEPIARGKLIEVKYPSRPWQPFDPLFAASKPSEILKLRSDGIYQSIPLNGGEYRYYLLQEGHYYQIKRNRVGWQLLDSRSPFRAYKPYVGTNTQGQWGIDPNKGALLGGMPETPAKPTAVETVKTGEDTQSPPAPEPLPDRSQSGSGIDSASMVSAEDPSESTPSSGVYHLAEESTQAAPYTHEELERMRSNKSYQYSQNYRRQYDRANNGRYPLRDIDGQPLRIKFIQQIAKSSTSDTTLHKDLVLPYIRWEGYEQVARLHDEKMEVVPFTAEHQKFPEEASLIGESTVITRRVIQKGEVLGVYGGELLPTQVATFRKDPYLMDVVATNLPKADTPGHPTMMTRDVMLSGDNITSRINTIFEYEEGRPVRQAKSGYNVESATFDVDVQKGNEPFKRMGLCVLFASQQIAAGAELRWNYSYTEPSVRKLFGAPPISSSSATTQA